MNRGSQRRVKSRIMGILNEVVEPPSIQRGEVPELDDVDPSFSSLHPADPALRDPERLGDLLLCHAPPLPRGDQPLEERAILGSMHISHTAESVSRCPLSKHWIASASSLYAVSG